MLRHVLSGLRPGSIPNGSTTWTFTYNADGIRTQKTDGTTVYKYTYNGSTLTQLDVGTNRLFFVYDGTSPTAVVFNNTTYYYVTNLQGDIIAILNGSGTKVVEYTYDAWGNILSTTGTLASTLGVLNPLRYRGYVYDTETGLYYLQSRYYNPDWGRFLNGDAFTSTGQGFIGNNMFAYCLNNPVNFIDSRGTDSVALQWWAGTMWWVCLVDTVLPYGDAIYLAGIIVLGTIALFDMLDDIPKATFDVTEVAYGSPAPNNNNDDDDDDDYYNDDSNFGGRQKIGKRRGKTPGNNQVQNKQFEDATKGILDKDQQRTLHKDIHGEGYGFHEIQELAKNLWLSFVGLFVDEDQ